MPTSYDQLQFSPRSGRPKIAPRFIAGNEAVISTRSPRCGRQRWPAVVMFAKDSVARFTGLVSFLLSVPSTEVLGYFRSSAPRTFMKSRLICSTSILALLSVSIVTKAQQPSPSPTPKKTTVEQPTSETTGEDAGDYTVTGTLEFGYRGIRV